MCLFVQFYTSLSVYLCTPKVKGHSCQLPRTYGSCLCTINLVISFVTYMCKLSICNLMNKLGFYYDFLFFGAVYK
uniref:Putative ovule protein n=1 Tax=Solanum chacoense TaxID=4108 RepID=A0A0V0HEP9_SOLCH